MTPKTRQARHTTPREVRSSLLFPRPIIRAWRGTVRCRHIRSQACLMCLATLTLSPTYTRRALRGLARWRLAT